MNFWSAIVMIVAILAFANIRIAKLNAHGQGGMNHLGRLGRGRAIRQALSDAAAAPDHARPSPRELELQREVESLRERVHVLERIATDGRSTQALADEIESLRGR